MTECRRGCGRCCDPVILSVRASQVVQEALAFNRDHLEGDLAFIRDHWTQRLDTDPGRLSSDGTMGELGSLWDCDAYDRATGDCRAYDARPRVCSGFPWYGGEPHQGVWLDMTCTFHADLGRRVLPVVAVS